MWFFEVQVQLIPIHAQTQTLPDQAFCASISITQTIPPSREQGTTEEVESKWLTWNGTVSSSVVPCSLLGRWFE
jgi:hypothetical protein